VVKINDTLEELNASFRAKVQRKIWNELLELVP
jgi:hypothetical protein